MDLIDLYTNFNKFTDYDEIVNDLCNGLISLDIKEHNTNILIHTLIKDQDMQMMFFKEDIFYLIEVESRIRRLTA